MWVLIVIILFQSSYYLSVWLIEKKRIACNIKLKNENDIKSGNICLSNEEYDKEGRGLGKNNAIELSK